LALGVGENVSVFGKQVHFFCILQKREIEKFSENRKWVCIVSTLLLLCHVVALRKKRRSDEATERRREKRRGALSIVMIVTQEGSGGHGGGSRAIGTDAIDITCGVIARWCLRSERACFDLRATKGKKRE
jgi:hypothetical protein